MVPINLYYDGSNYFKHVSQTITPGIIYNTGSLRSNDMPTHAFMIMRLYSYEYPEPILRAFARNFNFITLSLNMNYLF